MEVVASVRQSAGPVELSCGQNAIRRTANGRTPPFIPEPNHLSRASSSEGADSLSGGPAIEHESGSG
eukprot:1698966-Alexandrium_andersonii.AAC.1